MNNRVVLSAIAGIALVASSQAVFAAPTLGVRVPVQASFGKPKMISFNVRNETSEPIKIKAGDQKVTVDPGKTVPLKLVPGTSVVADEASAHYAAGAVITVAQQELNNSTLVMR